MARTPGSPIAPSTSSRSALAAWSQLVWFVVLAALWSGALLTLPTDPDYTAGEILDHLAGWMETGVLYPAPGQGETFRVLNYPPVSLLVARGVAALGASPLLAGRGANGLAFLALLAAFTLWARARGARGPVLAGTVGLLGASFPLLYASGQFHVELWAAAGTVAGFGLLDRGGSRWTPWLAGGALALACFAKHTQVVPAMVALAWAWRHRRDAAPAATAVFVGMGVAGSAGITAAWGMEAWRHLLTYTVGTYALWNLAFQAASHVLPWVVFLAFAAASVRREGATAAKDPLVWYGAGALAWSLSAARLGSSYPYFLDLHLALALWVGPRLFGSGAPWKGVAWRWLLAFQVVGANVGTGGVLLRNLAEQRALASALPELCAAVGGASGPVVTEAAGVARACGRPARLHPFIMTSLAQQGLWDPSTFVARLRQGAYGEALLPFPPGAPSDGDRLRWTPAMLDAFKEAPQVEEAAAGFWVARW